MKRIYLLTLSLFAFSFAQAQVTGVKSIPGDYPTLAAALADLNTQGVGSGGATINIAGGYTETAPAGGFQLGSTVLNASTAPDKRIIINGNNATMTAPAGTSTTVDGIFYIKGTDYVTIDQLSLQENAANTTAATAMEYGFAMVNLNNTGSLDGCQHDTIRNCTITLNRTIATASSAIYSGHQINTANTALTVTNDADLHSYNAFYGNNISNVVRGIYLNGYAASSTALYDQNNDIGGNSSTTGNTITNCLGNNYTSIGGITATYQHNANISYNTINNLTNGGVNGAATVWGIYAYGPGANFTLTHNILDISISAIATGYTIYGIYGNALETNYTTLYNSVRTRTVGGSSATNYCIFLPNAANLNITNNELIQNQAVNNTTYAIYSTSSGTEIIDYNTITQTSSVTTSAQFYSIVSGGASVSSSIQNNVFKGTNVSVGATSSIVMLIYSQNTIGNKTISNNSILDGLTVTSTGATYLIYNGNTAASTAGTAIISNNNFSGINKGGTGNLFGIYYTPSSGTVQNYEINNNIFDNITTSSTQSGMIMYGYGNTHNINNNQIRNITSTGTIFGIYHMAGSPATANTFNNKLYSLTTTGTTSGVFAITAEGGRTNNIYNNLIGNLNAPNTSGTTDLIRGINHNSAITNSSLNISFNTIYLNANSSGANFSTTGIYHTYSTTATTGNLTLRNNIVYNLSTPNGTGITAAFRRSAATNLNNYNTASSNNLFYSGTPGTNRLLYYDGTNAIQNITDLQTLVAPREAGSVSGTIDFLSLTGSSNDFLHINSYTPSIARGAAIPLTGITTDFDNETRHPSTPDIGADEMCKLELDSVRDGSHCGPGTVVLNAFGNPLTTEYRWYDEPTGGTLLGTTTTNAWTTPSITGTTTYYVAAANATCEWPTRTAVVATIIPLPLAPVITPNIDTIVCIGSSFNLTSNTVTGHTYGWEANPVVGAGTISGGNNISVTPTLTGNYVYTLTITETATGCSTSVNTGLVQVTAIPNPTISITSNIPSPLCSGVQVTFTANITDGGPTPDLTWYANSTNIGTGLSINYTPAGGEVITCSYVSSAPCASTTAIVSNGILMDVTTSVTPSVTISNNAPSPLCAGTSVLFNATPINGGPTPVLTWKSSTNGTIGTGTTLNYTPADGEVITCELQSSFACATASLVVSNAMTMAVNPILTPTVSISTNTAWPVCAGTSVTFTANTTNGGTLNYVVWKSGTNIINSGSLSFNYVPSDGEIITCELTSNQSCLSSTTAISAPFTTAVTPLPIINITPQGALTLCTGHSLTLTAHSGAGFYNWYKDGVNQGSNTSTYDATSAGTYYADVTINGCTTASNEVIITEVPEPIAVIMAQGPTRICNGQEVELTFVGNGDFVWERDGASLGINTVNYTANVSGIYTVSTTNTSCIITSNAIEVIVEPIPTAIIAYTGSNIVCEGTTVELRAAGSVADDYIWYNNNVMVGTGNTYTAAASGRYQYEAVVATCSTRSNIVNITVNPLPQPVIRQDGYIMYTDTFYNTYQWYREGVAMQGANNYRITAQSNGIYHVVVTDYAGCENRSNEIFINSYVGIDDVNVDAISIYPNPAKDVINIKAPVTVNASLFAMDGKLIKQQHNATQLSVADVAAGIYMLRVYNSNNQLIKVEKVSISNK